jgi:hypothetical protein
MWSIVLGLVMVLGQFASAAPDVSAGPAPSCGCPSCAQFNCCETTAPSAPLSPPASSSADFRVQAPSLSVVGLLATPPEVSCSIVLLSCERSLFQRACVLVYDRNCSYLI